MVQQDIQLFGCSVRDNLSLWNPAIREQDLVQACRDAEILDVVRGLPDGFDTQLNEGGQNLSGVNANGRAGAGVGEQPQHPGG